MSDPPQAVHGCNGRGWKHSEEDVGRSSKGMKQHQAAKHESDGQRESKQPFARQRFAVVIKGVDRQ